MMPHQNWPLDSPEHLEQALREQGEAGEDVDALSDALFRLAEWQAPTPAPTEARLLFARLEPLLPPGAEAARRARTADAARQTAVRAWKVAARQPRLIHRSIWIASAVAIAALALYAAALHGAGAIDTLGIFLPVIAAAGAAFLYSREADAGLEVALATPTAPRLVLFSRLMWLLGYDATLALGATLLVAAAHGQGIGSIAALWLGPMTLLSSGSLLVSLLAGPLVAACGTAALWLAQFTQLTNALDIQPGQGPSWQTSPLMFALAVLLVLLALAYVPRQERLT